MLWDQESVSNRLADYTIDERKSAQLAVNALRTGAGRRQLAGVAVYTGTGAPGFSKIYSDRSDLRWSAGLDTVLPRQWQPLHRLRRRADAEELPETTLLRTRDEFHAAGRVQI